MKNKSGNRKRKFTWDDELPEHSYLPTELLTEVLARLPVKTLVIFRLVCKLWCSIIDSSDFISMHLNVYNKNSSRHHHVLALLAFRSRYELTVRPSDSSRKTGDLGRIPGSYQIVGNCNGLMLMKKYPSSPKELVLYNPCIRKSLILPTCPLEYAVYILGFAPSSNEYKVFACKFSGRFSSENLEEATIAVYSLNDRQWRVKPNCWTNIWSWGRVDLTDGKRRVFCGGVLYWIGCASNHLHIMCVDFEVEKFSIMKLPEAAKGSNIIVKFLFVLGESLAIYVMSLKSSRIFVMEKDHQHNVDPWRLWFRGDPDLINSPFLLSNRFINLGYPFSKILYVEETNAFLIVIETSRVRKSYRLISYNIKTHQQKELIKPRNAMYLDTYVESLVLHAQKNSRTEFDFLSLMEERT
ncbi:F-box/kelch-repeat protein At3g23880-like [Spinacia oleracea]|uniref:F-box/kelch-repeat protein At3g23880-like n=1 Tax=Spinacia oleracea TaxID=3562 RepID=A0A9R0JFM7_SPIOL|nr:F-box/kelch-repeat protein At3g23880-like [Spinacia oleracea]